MIKLKSSKCGHTFRVDSPFKWDGVLRYTKSLCPKCEKKGGEG